MKKSEVVTIGISILALILSGIAIYFQIFYKNQEVYSSIIDVKCKSDTTLRLNAKIVYTNKGNTYSTILQNCFILYKKGNIEYEKYNQRVTFKNDIEGLDTYSPVILKPGEQALNEVILNACFETNKGNYSKYIGDTLKVAVYISFLNSKNLRTTKMIDIGWILLNQKLNIEKFNFNFKSEQLLSDGYDSGIEG